MTETVMIICPNCGAIVEGTIEYLWPFNSYSGYCERCNYEIMESEWEEAE